MVGRPSQWPYTVRPYATEKKGLFLSRCLSVSADAADWSQTIFARSHFATSLCPVSASTVLYPVHLCPLPGRGPFLALCGTEPRRERGEGEDTTRLDGARYYRRRMYTHTYANAYQLIVGKNESW